MTGGHQPDSRCTFFVPFMAPDRQSCVPKPAWALRVSNPRPSPCKGETNMQVRALSCGNVVSLSTVEYLGVPLRCYAMCYAESHSLVKGLGQPWRRTDR